MAEASAIEALLAAEGLPPGYADLLPVWARLGQDLLAVRAIRREPLVVGVCGAQGGGKTTAVKVLKLLLEQTGARVAVLSLDDLYLTRAERAVLARTVHPLLATRGVPGTHDVPLGLRVLDGLTRTPAKSGTLLPRFDKSVDDRAAPTEADVFAGLADVVLFEGWCVGARPQAPADLEAPINALERERDPEGVWRRHVNDELAGPYQELFARLGLLVLLEAPGFAQVLAWRTQQEHKLRATAPPGARVMSDTELADFIQHYERLTRHILAEMPARCNVRVRLNAQRRVTAYAKQLVI